MSMVTRCPSCETTFRVTPRQLQAHSGQVRCGRCMTVFDGFGALATLPDRRLEEPPARAAMDGDTRSVARLEPGAPAAAPAEPPVPDARPEASVPAADTPALEPGRSYPPPAPTLPEPPVEMQASLRPSAPDEVLPMTAPPSSGADDVAPAEPERQRGARSWAYAAAFMFAVLVVQAAHRYRVEIVAHYPALKPVAVRLCEFAGCSIPLPQRPQLITIEASDLQAQDPARPGMIQLTATLRNQASYELGYPALDLVLTNTKEHALARRIFMPEDYLEQSRSKTAGLSPNAETTVRLVLDTGDLGAVGFRLALLPAR